MDPIAAKYIGAGIACIGMGGAGVGVGAIFGHYLAAALRIVARGHDEGCCGWTHLQSDASSQSDPVRLTWEIEFDHWKPQSGYQ